MYDVVVIGAGIGGLTAGALLARRGQSVLVLERRDVPGGCCTAHVEAGYRFDIASSLFYGFGTEGFNANRRVLDELGVDLALVEHDPCFAVVHEGAPVPIHRNLMAWRDSLAAQFPSLGQGIARFYEELAHLHDQILKVGFYPMGDASLLELTRMAFGNPSMLLTYMPLLKKTVWGFVEPMLAGGDPAEIASFKRLLDVDLVFGSCSPSHEVPLLHATPILMDRHLGGVFYPMGGAAAVPATLVEGLKRHGGELRTGADVAEIVVRRGRAAGVRLRSGEVLGARRVICNANIWSLYGELLGESAPRAERRKAEKLKPSTSAFVVCVGVEASVLPEGFSNHTVVIPPGNDAMKDVSIVYAPSVDDPSLAPEGRHAVTLVNLADYQDWVPKGRDRAEPDAAVEAEHVARALRLAEAVLPGIGARGEVIATWSPVDLERKLGRRYGVVGGPAHTVKQSLNDRAGNRTPIEGLYLVGDSTYPGEGVVAVTISGLTCADQIAPRLDGASRG